MNPASRQHDAVTIYGAKQLAGNNRCGGHSHYGCLESHGAKNVGRREGAPLRFAAGFSRREQGIHIQPCRSDHIVHRATGKAMKQHAPVVEFADTQRGASVSVRGASGNPAASARSANLVQSV
ncbi:MAG: hypothetical protein WBP72_13470 [Rhodocyclaceae bacterium]